MSRFSLRRKSLFFKKFAQNLAARIWSARPNNRHSRRLSFGSKPTAMELLEDRALLSATHPIEPLFDAGTTAEYAQSVENSIDNYAATAEGQALFAQFQFNDGNRWSNTAFDGGGLTQGDATTITWGIVDDGTFIDSFGLGAAAGSDLISFLDGIRGAGPGGSDLTLRPWFSVFEDSFDRWSEVTGINYVFEANDDGAALTGASGVQGVRADVRIGGRFIDGETGSNTLAFNFFPTIGDMVIDTGNFNFYGNTANDSRSFRNVVMHEAGHGLGFNHVESSDQRFLMEPFIDSSFDGLQFDDILAGNRGYGDANEGNGGNDVSANGTNLGTFSAGQGITIGEDAADAVVARTDVDFVSIDDNSDVDFYRFTVGANSSVSLSLNPLGPSYQQGPQGGSQSTFNAQSQSDLTLQLISTDGSTVLATANANGIGIGELIDDFALASSGEFFVRISGAQNAAQMYQLDLSVTANTPNVTLDLSAAAPTLEGNAGSTLLTFVVTRTGDLSGATTVNYAVTGSGALSANANDFGGTLPSGTVNFAAGESSRAITVAVSGDTDVESDETFTVTLSNPSTGAQLGTSAATGTILNDDIDLSIASANADRSEGQSGLTQFTFTVTRTGDTSGATTVNYTVSSNSSNASDFGGNLPSGTVSFAAGETSQTITIQVSGDRDVEQDEAFTVTLSNASGNAEINSASANGVIRNDDVDLAISATDAVKAEGDSGSTSFTFTVTRTGDTSAATSVSYAVTGSGTNPADADDFGGTLPGGTVSFAAGETSQTITINVSGDSAVESDEGFTITLSAASSNADINTSTATGTILNDDSAPAGADIAIAAANASQSEGDSGVTAFTFVVTRSGNVSGSTTVDYTITGSGSSAADADDFGGSLPSGTVTFADGETSQTITVNVTGDETVESNENFTVTLSNASNGADIVTGSANGTILNDDVSNDGPSVNVVDGVLEIIGTDRRDRVYVFSYGSVYLVYASFLSGSRYRFIDASTVESINIDLRGGNDIAYLSSRVNVSATIDGGTGNDRLFGGSANDLLIGGDGHDRLYGRNGDDNLQGGRGNDRLIGNSGDDVLDGGDNNDRLYGGYGNDILLGGNGHDRLFGWTGNDVLVGGDGNDRLYGQYGRNILIGGLGSDYIIGGRGDDILIAGTTVFDSNLAALSSLRDEWSSSRSYEARVANLAGAGSGNRSNGDNFLQNGITVFDDTSRDRVSGGRGRDWFFFDPTLDRARRRSDEIFANDLGSILGP